jgi:Uncharacterized conserved protein
MSIIKHYNQRVAVLIDTQNLYHSAKNLYNARVNFGEMLNAAVGGRQLVRAIAYVITTETGEEIQFFEALTKIGIETKTKELQVFYGGNKKADWDVGMTIDAIRLAKKVDTIVLATGDGDFEPLVNYLKQNGVQVEIISFGKSSSTKLRESAEDFIDMSEYPDRFLLNTSHKKFTIKNQKRGSAVAQANNNNLQNEMIKIDNDGQISFNN